MLCLVVSCSKAWEWLLVSSAYYRLYAITDHTPGISDNKLQDPPPSTPPSTTPPSSTPPPTIPAFCQYTWRTQFSTFLTHYKSAICIFVNVCQIIVNSHLVPRGKTVQIQGLRIIFLVLWRNFKSNEIHGVTRWISVLRCKLEFPSSPHF